LRVDFAGGWLDVPRHARDGTFIVNCAIQPKVSLRDWGYERNAGLGGSGAWALLNGHTGVEEEIKLGVGWQDPAVIRETGLCLWWSGQSHNTPSMADEKRDYSAIEAASHMARKAVLESNVEQLATAVSCSYAAQLHEGMTPLPEVAGSIGRKYCGGGFGGYALYLFESKIRRDDFVSGNEAARAIEPYSNWE
jgi:hypothetical protein